MSNRSTITVEELRLLLFVLDNQEMTVRELRQLLFNEQNQQAVVDGNMLRTTEFNATIARLVNQA
jgi:predicted metallo-beta-lactamase superfamily hydrolase